MRIVAILFMILSSIHAATLVVTEPIKSGVLNSNYNYIGSLYFSDRSSLASELSGIIDEIYVNEGDKIKKGEPLARLNSDLLTKEINSQQALLKQGEALLKKTKKEFQRYESLYKSNSIAYKEYEDALYNLQAQEGNTDSIAANLEYLKTQKEKKTIKAPYDGVILQKLLKQGEWVGNGDSIFNIAKLSPLEASIEVPFEILRSLKVGDVVDAQIANKHFKAKIIALIPLGDSKARTFPIKLAIDDENGELIEGLEVRVSLNISDKQKALFVTRDSIIPIYRDGKTSYVIFIAKDNKAKQVEIKINGYEGLYASITPLDESLSTNNKVITQGHERLKDGQEIKEQESKN